MHDVVIIGAGASGLACAYELAKRGARVLVVERDANAVEAASQRAAGMLSAQLEHHPSEAMAALCLESRELHKTLLAELEARTGVDLDHRSTGALRLAFEEDEAAELEALVVEQEARGWEVTRLTPREAVQLEPLLGDVLAAAWFAGERVGDPPRLVLALRRACELQGVVLREGVEVARLTAGAQRVDGIALASGERIAARDVVVAGGAWSASIEGTGIEGLVRPIRGQMLELQNRSVPRRLLDAPGAYLSPRSDGRVLVGSTLEDVGFERAVTAGAASRLLSTALRLVPALTDASLSNHWCGFRSTTRDKLPLLGRTRTGAIAATGHHRNGIVLSAITALVVADLLMGTPSSLALEAFRPDRDSLARPSLT
jgi:glycine oxidase